MRRVADGVMGGPARVLVHVFFRRVEVEHAAALPRAARSCSSPTTNASVGAPLLVASLRRYPRVLGKSTLFSIAPLWPLLTLAGVLPVYRAGDGVGHLEVITGRGPAWPAVADYRGPRRA